MRSLQSGIATQVSRREGAEHHRNAETDALLKGQAGEIQDRTHQRSDETDEQPSHRNRRADQHAVILRRLPPTLAWPRWQ